MPKEIKISALSGDFLQNGYGVGKLFAQRVPFARHTVRGRISRRQKRDGHEVFRQTESFPHDFGVQVPHPCGAEPLRRRFKHHISRYNGGVDLAAVFAVERPRPAERVVITDEKRKRRVEMINRAFLSFSRASPLSSTKIRCGWLFFAVGAILAAFSIASIFSFSTFLPSNFLTEYLLFKTSSNCIRTSVSEGKHYHAARHKIQYRIMHLTFAETARAVAVAVILSTDIFACGLAYGAGKIKIPVKSAAVISIICGLSLGLTSFIGGIIRPYISARAIKYISFAVLLAIGLFKLFEEVLRALLARTTRKELSLNLLGFRLILKVFQDETEADKNKDKILSSAEAVSLAAATSLDSLAVGFSAGLGSAPVWLLPLAVTLVSFAAVLCGTAAGKKAAAKSRINLSWISGAVLVIIAVTKLF